LVRGVGSSKQLSFTLAAAVVAVANNHLTAGVITGGVSSPRSGV